MLNNSIAGGPLVRPNQQEINSSRNCHVIVPQNLSGVVGSHRGAKDVKGSHTTSSIDRKK